MIDSTVFLGIVSFGLLGSAHCAGMCGPLAIGACVRGGRASLSASLTYLGGRMVSYAVGGAMVGAMGRHALCRLPVRTIEVAVAVIVGVLALGRGLQLLSSRRGGLVRLGRKAPSTQPSSTNEGFRFVASLLPSTSLGLGLVTGFLPCGMLLSALVVAATSANPVSGAALMVAFGVASLPGLAGPMIVRGWLGDRWSSPRFVGAAWCVLGLLMLVRPALVGAHCAMP